MDFNAGLPQEIGVDASGIDANLRAVRAVEAGWRLPQLPDDVKFDLASNSAVEDLAGFLAGLDKDYHGENDEDVYVAPPPPLVIASQYGQFSQGARSTYDSLRVGFADIAGERSISDTIENHRRIAESAFNGGCNSEDGE
jgi:hypothetical protein